MRYLLDTDTCVHWLRGRERVRERLARVGQDQVGVSTVTLAELYYGAACSARPEANAEAVDEFAKGLALITLDPQGARTFGELKVSLRQKGQLIEDCDLLIAATAHTHGLILVTGNTSHFQRLPGLLLEDWTEQE